MSALRNRKATLIIALKAHRLGGTLTEQQVQTFEMMYRRAHSQQEQDQVTQVVRQTIEGWKTENDRYSRLRRAMNDLDDLAEPEED